MCIPQSCAAEAAGRHSEGRAFTFVVSKSINRFRTVSIPRDPARLLLCQCDAETRKPMLLGPCQCLHSRFHRICLGV